MGISGELRLVANYHCRCGENPLWDETTGRLYWTDIPTGRLFVYDAASDAHEPIYAGPPVGGFTFQDDGSLLLFRVEDIAVRHADGRVETRLPFADDGVPRFNDVLADPQGRVFAGTMGQDHRGGVYRLDCDGTLSNLWRGTNCSNGLALAGDLQTLYWTDTPGRTIYAFDYDRSTGELAGRRALIQTSPDQGGPDGLTVDTRGRLYSAGYGGSAVFVYDPDGRAVDRIDLPVAKVTSCVFGGEGLDELFITTAGGDGDGDGDASAGLDGALFSLRLAATGRPEFRSRVRPPSA